MVSDKKIVVPEGMRKAAGRATFDVDPEGYIILPGLEAALRWLSENAPQPTSRQLQEISDSLTEQGDSFHSMEAYCREWVRRMFLYSDPEVDRVDLYTKTADGRFIPWEPSEIQELMLEAYRRGLKAKP